MVERFDLQILADNIRAERSRKNISQSKLAEMVGVTPPTIHVIEKVKNTPKIDLVVDIANALGVDISTLITKK